MAEPPLAFGLATAGDLNPPCPINEVPVFDASPVFAPLPTAPPCGLKVLDGAEFCPEKFPVGLNVLDGLNPLDGLVDSED